MKFDAEQFSSWLLENEKNFISFLAVNNPDGLADALNKLNVDLGPVTEYELEQKTLQWFKSLNGVERKKAIECLLKIQLPKNVKIPA
jgi:hypothetical protein